MHKNKSLTSEQFKKAIASESQGFEKMLRWLEEHLPPAFIEETDPEMKILVARNLMSLPLQDHFCLIRLKEMAIVLTIDGPDSDLKVLSKFHHQAIRYYRAFVSDEPVPGENKGLLRIAILHFKEQEITGLTEQQKQLVAELGFSPHFIQSLPEERLKMAIEVFTKAKERDDCQYALRKNEDWKKKKSPSLQIVLAWRSVPKSGFLYRLAQVIHQHGLTLKKVTATDVQPHSPNNVLVLSIGLHGQDGRAVWEVTDLDDLLREICLVKYFETEDLVQKELVAKRYLTGNEAHFIRTLVSFTHQALVHADPNLYSRDHILEAFLRHPEFTVSFCKAFEARFHPKHHHPKKYESICQELTSAIQKMDTGQALNDQRRKNILQTALVFIDCSLKTNFYCANKTAFSFRVDPSYLRKLPYDTSVKFPEVPFGVFFIRGMHFIGFNIRFRDLARGGFRTVIPERWEVYAQERNTIFQEAYNLALTQQKKNKDIPEGGAKTALLLAPFDVFSQEEKLYLAELEQDKIKDVDKHIQEYRQAHKLAYLFASQRAFIESLMTLLNNGVEIDYWKRPEYLYLGPDENMRNEMIEWISNYSESVGYRPGRSFMSSKPTAGINHKQYGVTSYGVCVYLQETLHALGIDPKKDPFTIKISGGPDGDVAGNVIHILAHRFPKTAKLLALTDVSGTIYDPEGLDWEELDHLFKEGLSIRFYPPKKLHEGAFLLDLQTKREESAYAQQTLCWVKEKGTIQETWLSGNEMNHLYRNNVHQAKTDLFVPGGGRPRTLNENNIQTFLDKEGKPTARAIVEGANLYLTPTARRTLEDLGVIVLKDSSCNKGGVITSSFEVLAGLTLSDEEFLQGKETYVKDVLRIIEIASQREAQLILQTHAKTNAYYTDISEKISERINLYKDQLLHHLEKTTWHLDDSNPLLPCLFRYCPAFLRENYPKRILQIPEIHQKAIVAVFLAARLVYLRGLEWTPSVADIIETIAQDHTILDA